MNVTLSSHFASYPIGILCDSVYKLALRIGLVKPSTISALDLESGTNQSLGSARAEAERRR